jgi:hypothetical protein
MRHKVLFASLALAGCLDARELAPVLPCTTSEDGLLVADVSSADVADVVIVVDGSDGMAGPRARLVAALPRFLDGLARGDLDHDGLIDATPMRSIHVGVVSSGGCTAYGESPFVRGAETDPNGVVALDAGDGRTPDDVARAVELALAVTHECGEPAAIATATDAVESLPRDDDGLLRPEGALVVIVLARHDDAGPPWRRLAFERVDPDMVVLTVLAGASGEDTQACAVLDPSVDAARNLVQAASDEAAYGVATVVEPICADDYLSALDRTSVALSRCVIGVGTCLARSFVRVGDGRIDAVLEEILPPIDGGARYTHCAQLEPPGIYERVGMEHWYDGDREVCRMRQLAASEVLGTGDPGWFWDDGTFGALSTNPQYCDSTIGLHGTGFVIGASVRLRFADREHAEGPTVECTTDADCTAGGLVGHACDPDRHLCVVPTCRDPLAPLPAY